MSNTSSITATRKITVVSQRVAIGVGLVVAIVLLSFFSNMAFNATASIIGSEPLIIKLESPAIDMTFKANEPITFRASASGTGVGESSQITFVSTYGSSTNLSSLAYTIDNKIVREFIYKYERSGIYRPYVNITVVNGWSKITKTARIRIRIAPLNEVPAGAVGDANGDLTITDSDVSLIFNHYLDYQNNIDTYICVMDANGDETITPEDALLVKNYLLNKIDGGNRAIGGTGTVCKTGIIAKYHSADVNKDYKIDKAELDYVVTLQNGYHCDAKAYSGYAPGDVAVNSACTPHSSDYLNGADWKINTSELLRLIQFFNAGGYKVDPTGEDGFAPVL